MRAQNVPVAAERFEKVKKCFTLFSIFFFFKFTNLDRLPLFVNFFIIYFFLFTTTIKLSPLLIPIIKI